MKNINSLKIVPSIDVVFIFIPVSLTSPMNVHAILTLHGFICRRFTTGTCIFQKTSYQVSTRRVLNNNICLGTTIRIARPDRHVLMAVEQLFSGMYSISSAEFTLDIFSIDPTAMFSRLRRITYLKWAGKTPSLSYKTTFYIGNPRKTKAKGLRCYIKEHSSGLTSVRLEVVHKRSLFRKRKITSLPALGSIQIQEVFNHVQFNELDPQRISPNMNRLGIYRGDCGNLYAILKDVAKAFIWTGMTMLSDSYSANYAKDVNREFCRSPYNMYKRHWFQGVFERLTNGRTFI